jgi:hypothetical protein
VFAAGTPLPVPSTVLALDDVPAAFDTTDWDFGTWSVSQPQAGLALGRLNGDDPRIVAADTWFVITSDFALLRVSFARLEDGLQLTIARALVSRTTLVPGPFSADELVVIAPSADVQWLDLSAATGLMAEPPAAARWPESPPPSRDFDIAWVRNEQGEWLHLSTATVVLNATRLGLDETTAPMTAGNR